MTKRRVPRQYTCLDCELLSAQAQKAHQLRECAPELLAEVKSYYKAAEGAWLELCKAGGSEESQRLILSGRKRLNATAELIARAESRN